MRQAGDDPGAGRGLASGADRGRPGIQGRGGPRLIASSPGGRLERRPGGQAGADRGLWSLQQSGARARAGMAPEPSYAAVPLDELLAAVLRRAGGGGSSAEDTRIGRDALRETRPARAGMRRRRAGRGSTGAARERPTHSLARVALHTHSLTHSGQRAPAQRLQQGGNGTWGHMGVFAQGATVATRAPPGAHHNKDATNLCIAQGATIARRAPPGGDGGALCDAQGAEAHVAAAHGGKCTGGRHRTPCTTRGASRDATRRGDSHGGGTRGGAQLGRHAGAMLSVSFRPPLCLSPSARAGRGGTLLRRNL